MEISDHLTCLLRNLYARQEATVRTGNGTTDWFQIGKGVCQGCILSPCLFNLYAEYIMRNPGLDEAQDGMKIARRNFNNLRCADDTTFIFLFFILWWVLSYIEMKQPWVYMWKSPSRKIWNASRICISSLRRGHVNLLCIIPILVYVLLKRARHHLYGRK